MDMLRCEEVTDSILDVVSGDEELVKIEVPIELAEVLSSGRGLGENGAVQRFCRVCLHTSADLSCIFEARVKGLADMLSSFTSIQFSPEDGMPSCVCSDCRELIIQSYLFKQKCERSDSALRAFLHGEIMHNIKSEGDGSTIYMDSGITDTIDYDKNSCSSEDESSQFKYEIDMVLDNETEHKYSDPSFNKPKAILITKEDKEFRKQETIKEDRKNFEKRSRELCGLCKKSFKDAERLSRHMEEVHDTKSSKKCEVCAKTFKSARGLRQHMKSAHCDSEIERPFKCLLCALSFLSEKDLKIHSSVHAEGMLSCYECQKQFSTIVQLKRHIKRHMDDKPYKCELCHKTFCEISALYRHQNSHFGTTAVEKKYSCAVCNKRFAEKTVLTVHMRQHTGERPYECVDCGKSFPSARLLSSHMRTHIELKPYKCGMCDKSFRHTATLATHRRTHTGERPYICSICGKSFIQSSNLTLHTRVHSGERPYACSVCGRRFTSWSTMKAHERIHTGEKPYSCKICGQRFARVDLKVHMRRHSGERPFTCTLCDKSFFTSLRLAEHSRLHTGIKPFECGICGLKVATKATYMRHMKKHGYGHPSKKKHNVKPKISLVAVELNQSESMETSALHICDNVDGVETVIDQSGNIEEVIREQDSLLECGDIQMPSIDAKGFYGENETPIKNLTVTTGKGRRLSVFRIESSNGQILMSDIMRRDDHQDISVVTPDLNLS